MFLGFSFRILGATEEDRILFALMRLDSMKSYSQRMCRRLIGIAALFLLNLSPVDAEGPTLARLSFWVPPERMTEFEVAYEEQAVPILRKHGLVESSQSGRTTPDSIFSRLFEVGTPGEVAVKAHALQQDPAGREVLQRFGMTFGTTKPGAIRIYFGLYQTPVGSGKIVEAGPGFRRRLWQTFSIQDGLPSSIILDILQDREGHLWFGTEDGGVCRYDGTTFTTYTTADGLAHNTVRSMMEDQEGHLWFGTEGGGVCRYDGTTFITYTTADGLAHNAVTSMTEDQEGNLWFGAWGGGLSRYDGNAFTTYTTEHGLAHNTVVSMLEDQEGNLWFGTYGGVRRRKQIKVSSICDC